MISSRRLRLSAWTWWLLLSAPSSSSFVLRPSASISCMSPQVNGAFYSTVHGRSTSRCDMLPDTSSILTAVDIFDGSTIVDPVVVSDVFWSSLKGKVIAVVIGQFLATVAFGALSWLVTTQLSSLGSSISGSLSSTSNNSKTPQSPSSSGSFKKATEIRGFDRPPPDLGKLLVCLTIDVLGSSSEVIPILGELTDIVYAPIAATVLRSLYGSNIIFGLEFVEEILPLTDILPLATICWVIDTYFYDSDVAKVLKLGDYSPNNMAEGVIDTTATRRDDSR